MSKAFSRDNSCWHVLPQDRSVRVLAGLRVGRRSSTPSGRTAAGPRRPAPCRRRQSPIRASDRMQRSPLSPLTWCCWPEHRCASTKPFRCGRESATWIPEARRPSSRPRLSPRKERSATKSSEKEGCRHRVRVIRFSKVVLRGRPASGKRARPDAAAWPSRCSSPPRKKPPVTGRDIQDALAVALLHQKREAGYNLAMSCAIAVLLLALWHRSW